MNLWKRLSRTINRPLPKLRSQDTVPSKSLCIYALLIYSIIVLLHCRITKRGRLRHQNRHPWSRWPPPQVCFAPKHANCTIVLIKFTTTNQTIQMFFIHYFSINRIQNHFEVFVTYLHLKVVTTLLYNALAFVLWNILVWLIPFQLPN